MFLRGYIGCVISYLGLIFLYFFYRINKRGFIFYQRKVFILVKKCIYTSKESVETDKQI